MSSFLLVFDREIGQLLEFRKLENAKTAEEERLQLELEHRCEPGFEIVVLEAESQEQLRSTHARYFGSAGLEDLAKAARSSK